MEPYTTIPLQEHHGMQTILRFLTVVGDATSDQIAALHMFAGQRLLSEALLWCMAAEGLITRELLGEGARDVYAVALTPTGSAAILADIPEATHQ